jgi:hypothetical protein
VRAGLKPTYRTTSPDFIIRKLPLGIEATMRDVPLPRAVAERLTLALAFLDFKHLSIAITAKRKHDTDEVVERITKDVKESLDAGDTELTRPDYRIEHELIESGEKTVVIAFGEYRYEETLSHLITTLLKEKEEKIHKGLAGGPQIKSAAAIDTRSLLALPLEPETDYERQMAE